MTVVIATIRTAVPALVGLFVAWLAGRGVNADPELVEQWETAIVAGAAIGYYLLVTLLERRVHPSFGWLLGADSAPEYLPRELTRAAREDDVS